MGLKNTITWKLRAIIICTAPASCGLFAFASARVLTAAPVAPGPAVAVLVDTAKHRSSRQNHKPNNCRQIPKSKHGTIP